MDAVRVASEDTCGWCMELPPLEGERYCAVCKPKAEQNQREVEEFNERLRSDPAFRKDMLTARAKMLPIARAMSALIEVFLPVCSRCGINRVEGERLKDRLDLEAPLPVCKECRGQAIN